MTLERLIRSQLTAANVKSSYLNYHGYPFVASFDVNDQVVHSSPTSYRLRDGDIVTVSFGVVLSGYHAFQSVTYPVGTLRTEDASLVWTAHRALEAAINSAQPGRRLGDISAAIQTTAESAGFHVPKEYGGCGVGTGHHEEPYIPNHGPAGRGMRLRVGHVFSLNPIVTQGSDRVRLADDGWTVLASTGQRAAAMSHIVAITDLGPEVLTPYNIDWIRRVSTNPSLVIVEANQELKVFPASSLDEIRRVQVGNNQDLVIASTQALSRDLHAVLGEEIEEFEWLLNKRKVQEQDLHSFLERHPNFLLGDEYKSIRSKVILESESGDRLVPDFFLEPLVGEFWDILELKLPQKPLIVGSVNRRQFSQHVMSASAQLRTYAKYFDDPRNRARLFREQGINAYKPRLAVLVGQSFLHEEFVRREIEHDFPRLRVLTYEELLLRAKRRCVGGR